MNNCVLVTRFELSFEGEPQGVGMFQGLGDIGLTNLQIENLLKQFNDLCVPNLEDNIYEPISFWFTPLGIKHFYRSLNKVQSTLQKHGWSLIVSQIDPLDLDVVYHDLYQVAFPEEQIKNLMPKYIQYDAFLCS